MLPTVDIPAEFFEQLFDAAPDAVVVVDERGTIRLANHRVEDLLGWAPGDLVGRRLEVLLPPALKDRHVGLRQGYAAAPVPRGMGAGADLVAVRADGTEIAVDVSLSPIRVEGDDGRYVSAAIRDATARRAYEQALEASEERLRSSLESMLDGFAVVRAIRDRGRIVDFEWTYINAVGASTYGRPVDELIGARMGDVLPGWTTTGALEDYSRVVETGQPWRDERYTYDDAVVSGMFELRGWRLGDGVAVTWRDVTERERAAEALRRSEERFRGSVENLHDALSVFTSIRDDDGVIVDFSWDYANVQAGLIVGRPCSEIVGSTLLQVLPAHGGSGGLLERYRDVVETGEAWIEPTLWYEDTWGDGTTARRAFDVRATRLHDGFVVVSRDVTTKRLADEHQARRREELERSNAEIRRLNELGDLLQSCTSADEAYAVAGPVLATLFPGLSGVFSVTRAASGLMETVARWGAPGGSAALTAPQDCWALRRGRPHVSGRDAPRCAHLADDVEVAVCSPMVGQGETVGVLHIVAAASAGMTVAAMREDVVPLATTIARQVALAAANLDLRDRLHDLSIRDPLTGLFNRRYMEETLAREVARASRESGAVSVVQFDVDHFKACNDMYGHGAGDAVLIAIGRAIEASFRASDVVCRYGGEEFTVILPGCGAQDAAAHARELQSRVADLHIGHAGTVLPTRTLSGGVAAFPTHARTPEKLLRVADAALYRAKHEGRDAVVVADAAGTAGAEGTTGGVRSAGDAPAPVRAIRLRPPTP